MKGVHLFFLIVIIFSIFIFSHSIRAQPSKKYMVKTLELLVDEALMGYNLEDYTKFYKYFAEAMKPIATEQYFRAVYIDTHKKSFGFCEVKRLLPEQSSLDPDFPVLVYEGIFEKCDQVLITVNFVKEYDNYRITRINFDRLRFGKNYN